MKKRLIGVAAFAASLVFVSPAQAIVGGSADAGEHPYVGQLLFFVPSEVDPRFDDAGAWFNCTGTLINPTTVLTAGHCTFDVGVDGESTGNDGLSGGSDIWFSLDAAPDYSILPPSAGFVPGNNAGRYDAWSAALDLSPSWHSAEAVFTHPEYVDAAFLLHDVGVFTLSDPVELDEYGALPDLGHLDGYAGSAKSTALFESVGYGLEDSSPKTSFGGDTRKKADRRLISFKGAYGYRDIAVVFSHSTARGANGGTCFGDSGGPTFDITGSPDGKGNVVVAVTSFGLNYNCNASGSYRIDQADDLAFIAAHS